MRRSIAALLFLCAPAAAHAADSRSIRISFDLSQCGKDTFCPSDRLVGEGLVVGSGEDGTVAYAEVKTKHGPNATVEFLKSGNEWVVHYWESSSAGLSFFGVISDAVVEPADSSGAWTLGGNFSFRAVDEQQIRVIDHGVIEMLGRPSNPDPDPGCYNCGNGGTTVIIVDEGGGCGGSEPPPDDGSSGGCEGDTTTDDPYTDSSGGCEGDTSTSDSSSSGGCEGDTCDSASSGGCDSGDSSSSSSGCEGDGYQASVQDIKSRRASNSMFRLAWPIVLAGGINRALKARAAKKTRPQLSR